MKYEKVKNIVQKTDPKVILACANICDGHTIFKPEAFTDKGLDERVVDHYSQTHLSDPDNPKEQITANNGCQVEQMKGVYGLDLLYGLAHMLKINYEGKMGRGSQACAIQKALHKELAVEI